MGKIITLPSKKGEPVWELAELFPYQGTWSEEAYLVLGTSKLVEFTDGYVELLPMPSPIHQYIVAYLYRLLFLFVSAQNLGDVLFAPLRVRIKKGSYREPDIVFLLAEHHEHKKAQYWSGADLVIEVVSPDNPQRDTIQKRKEYAEAGIPEYWIVNPLDETITVLIVDGDVYKEHGIFGRGEEASSILLEGFTADVAAVFDAPQ